MRRIGLQSKNNLSYEVIIYSYSRNGPRKLYNDPSKKRILKDVIKTFNIMETNLRHPSLNTHEFKSLKGPHGEKMFEAYAQQKHQELIGYFGIMGPKRNR